MDADRRNRPSRGTRVKVRLVAATLGALSVMAALILAVFQPGNESRAVAYTQPPPATTVPPKAEPTLKAPHNGGWDGGWIGSGPFKGKDWNGFGGW